MEDVGQAELLDAGRQGQILDGFFSDRIANGGTVGLQYSCLATHLKSLRYLADYHLRIHALAVSRSEP